MNAPARPLATVIEPAGPRAIAVPSPELPLRRFLSSVLAPYLVTRAMLIATGWFAAAFPINRAYPASPTVERGWGFVPWPWLDVWGRWDSIWYLDVARNGYRLMGPLATTQSNVAFFPLYPALVAGLHALLPASWQGERALFFAGVLLSNGFALAALWLVHEWVRESWGDAALARRATLYLLLFPAGFFLGCIYSESLFLLLAVLVFRCAERRQWWRAGLAALLLASTRPAGVLIALPLAWMLFASGERDWRRVASLALAPLGLLAHALHLRAVTGDPLALFHAQRAWNRSLAPPWRILVHPVDFHPWMGPIEALALALFFGLGLWLLRRRQDRPYGLFVLASLAPIFASGMLVSAARFVSVLFPGFALLARAGRRELIDRTVTLVFAAGQILLFFAWSRFYWVN